MKILCASLFLGLVPWLMAADPSTVLVLVNDSVPAEEGTGETGASIWVGEQYAALRNIPAENILHINSAMACCNYSPLAWDSWNISLDRFNQEIREPVNGFLDTHPDILYIVPTYGVPVRISDRSGGAAIDSYLIRPSVDAIASGNPYYNSDEALATFGHPSTGRVYAVTRLDGPSAVASLALVKRAMRAEVVGLPSNCLAYIDKRQDHRAPSIDNVANVFEGKVTTHLNMNVGAASMIKDAPNACFAWGWYSGNISWPGYQFVEGAVGSQLTSYTAIRIRTPDPNGGNVRGSWVGRWLAQENPITATWGATTEPFQGWYTQGDVLFRGMLAGRTFGEAFLAATPRLNWAMIGVGDPLYTLHVREGCDCEPDPIPPPPPGENSLPILSPTEGSVFQEGALITFENIAQDDKGESMCGRVFWSSRRSGGIGTGCNFQKTLPPGRHKIRASFVNDEGVRTSAWVEVLVLVAP